MELGNLNILIQLAAGAATIYGTWKVIQFKISQHDENIAEIKAEAKQTYAKLDTELKESFEKRDKELKDKTNELEKRLNASFSKLDDLKEKCNDLEKNIDRKASLKEVRAEFITRQELELKLDNIKQITENTNREIAKMEKSIDNILAILQKVE